MSRSLSASLLSGVTALALLAGIGAVDARPRNEPDHKPWTNDKRAFKDEEREAIGEYFESNPSAAKKMPPGLAKKNKLPPGWQKKIERGEVVPDDVWRHRVQLPRDVTRRLPPNPPGTVTVRIDDKVVRVIETTREVLDIFGLPTF